MKNMYMKFGLYLYLLSCLFMLGGMGSSYYNQSLLMEFYMFSLSNISVCYILYLDWISLFFISMILFISANVMIFSKNYMDGEVFETRFVHLLILFIMSMLLMVISPNLISIMLGWDGLGLVSYCLVIFYQNKTAYNAGMITILSNRIGDFGLIMSIILMMMVGWNIMMIDKMSYLCIFMLLLAAFTKSAQFPFSAWLPAAMSAPTPVSALVHSSTLVTAGVYLMIRANSVVNLLGVDEMIMIISLLTILVSGLAANMESDMKKIVAMSTLSQLGFMMFVFSLGVWKIAYFHMITHALFKSLLFLSVGYILHSYQGSQDMRNMGGSGNMIFSSSLGILVSSMCLFGLPFVSGFYSKEYIIMMMLNSQMKIIMIFLFVVGMGLTILYSIRMVLMSLVFVTMGFVDSSMSESWEIFIPISLLSMFSIFMGSNLEWLCFDPLGGVIHSDLNIMIFMGIVVVVLIRFNMNLNFNFYFFKKMKIMMFSIWNLPDISTYIGKSMMIFDHSDVNDYMWGEIMGAMGAKKMLMSSVKMIYSQMTSIILLFLSLMIVILLFIYTK